MTRMCQRLAFNLDTVNNQLSEDEFWARFFMSKLKKRLSGEAISDKDPVDDIMDKYLRPDFDRISAHNPVDCRAEQKTNERGRGP